VAGFDEPGHHLRGDGHPTLTWSFAWNRNPHERDGNGSDVGVQIGFVADLLVTEPGERARLRCVDLFITSMVLYTGLLAVLAAPLFYVTWRKDRLTAARNFGISALVIAMLCAVLAVVSERQVLQCLDAGNSDCFDSGAVGLQLLFVGIYVAIAWSNAFWMWRD
jgi:hypothetical protein